MCREDVVVLSARGDATAEGRAWVEAFLRRSYASGDGLVDDAVLVASELLTNALRAGAPWLELRLTAHVDELCVGVRDAVPGRPGPGRRVVAPTDPAGRGLAVVERVALSWGVDDDGDTKTVWVTLPVPAGTAARFNCVRDPADGAGSGVHDVDGRGRVPGEHAGQ